MDQPLPDLPTRMSRTDYYRWAERQPRGRFELVSGRVIAMAPERIGHVRTIFRSSTACSIADSVAPGVRKPIAQSAFR